MSFAKDVAEWAKKAQVSQEEVIKAVHTELFQSVIDDTPVATGRLRGNWQATKATPATGEINRKGKSAAKKEAADTIDSWNLNGSVYLTNNLPYAYVTEYEGNSNQAPNGMVRKNIARVSAIVRKQARRIKRKNNV